MNARLSIVASLAAALAAGACTLTPQPVPPWEDGWQDAPADLFGDTTDVAWDPSDAVDAVSDPMPDADVVDVPPDVVPDVIPDTVEEDAGDVSGEEMMDIVEEDVETDEAEEVEDAEEIEEPDEIEEIEEIEETEEDDWLEEDLIAF